MIVDANVVVSASLGRSRSLVRAVLGDHGLLMIPEAQHREARLVSASCAERLMLDPRDVFGWTATVLLPIPHAIYDGFEAEARARLRGGGEKDWPLVALALASGEAVWSNGVDLFGTGIVVWNTHNIARARHAAPIGAEPQTGNDHG